MFRVKVTKIEPGNYALTGCDGTKARTYSKGRNRVHGTRWALVGVELPGLFLDFASKHDAVTYFGKNVVTRCPSETGG